MLQKWTEKEDQELARIIRKYGTTDWALIRKQFKSSRSRDSVIKRWHGKLKYEKSNMPKTKKIVPPLNKANPQNRRAREITRSVSKITTKKTRHHLVANPTLRTKFRRLQNFIAGTVGTRTKKSKSNDEIKPTNIAVVPRQQYSKEQLFMNNWSKNDDQKLRSLVIQQGITSWNKIANLMSYPEKQVQLRWRKSIYKTIKLEDKVGGFLKYSSEEDNILMIGHRNGLTWEELISFLPERSEFSIEARWRRLARPELQLQLSKNKHYFMRQFMKKIVEKKRQQKYMVPQKPDSQKQGKSSS